MTHSEAVQLKAAEKYALRELPDDLREQFEEHYFDCTECASDLQALATFLTASRMVFDEEAASGARAREPEAARARLRWWQPALATCAIVILAGMVVFQRTVTIPALKERTAGSVAQVYESSYRVYGATRGETRSIVTVDPNQSFALDFDFTPAKQFANYQGNLLDAAGHPILTFDVPAGEMNKELHLVVPGGKVHRGTYDLVLLGVDVGASPSEVQRLTFVVEVRS